MPLVPGKDELRLWKHKEPNEPIITLRTLICLQWPAGVPNDGTNACVTPRGGQRRSSRPPVVSVILTFQNHFKATEQALLAVLRDASEVPSAEFILVDDGSLHVPNVDPTTSIVAQKVEVVRVSTKMRDVSPREMSPREMATQSAEGELWTYGVMTTKCLFSHVIDRS